MVRISDEQRDKWDNEIALVRVTGACPYCDGPVDRSLQTNPNDDRIAHWDCQDCSEQWIAKVDALPGTVEENEYRVK